MRDVNRIVPFMETLAQIWKDNLPDWRFGQLMYNFIADFGDPYYLEEDEFIEKFSEYVTKVKGGYHG